MNYLQVYHSCFTTRILLTHPLLCQVRYLGMPTTLYQEGTDPDMSDNPNEFDILLLDISHLTLHAGVSRSLGRQYLSRVEEDLGTKSLMSVVHEVVIGAMVGYFILYQ